jgi:thioredoxin 1
MSSAPVGTRSSLGNHMPTTIEDIDSSGLAAVFRSVEAPTPGSWTLIDFWAPWCAPCRALHPILSEVATRIQTELRMVRVNLDAVVGVAEQFGIRSIPTLLLVRDGREIARQNGVQSARALIVWLRNQGVDVPDVQSLPGSAYDENDARRLGAFYGDPDLQRFLLDRLLRFAQVHQIARDRIPHFTRTGDGMRATISTALVGGGMADLFVRITGMPLGISALLHLCSPSKPAEIEALVGSIQPGADLRRVPLRFMIDWLSDDYAQWPTILDDDAADALRRDWLSLARGSLDAELLYEAWAPLRSRATELRNLPPERTIGRHLAGLLLENMPTDPDAPDWCRSLFLQGIFLQFLEGFRLHKMTTAEIAWEGVWLRWLEDLQAREKLSNEECLRRRQAEFGELDDRNRQLREGGWKCQELIKARHTQMLQKLLAAAPLVSRLN